MQHMTTTPDKRAAGAQEDGTWGWRCGGGGGGGGCQSRLPMPLDSEGKACRLDVLSCAPPHLRCFHLAWTTHFVAVFAAFAAAPLLPVIRDNLDLTKAQVSAAGIAAVSGTVFSRLLAGGVCDRWGPRAAAGTMQLLTAAGSFGMAVVSNAAGFIAMRLVIGFALASFVACQFWCSVMFNARIVGAANAVAAGWGNTGGGVVQLVMPLLLQAFAVSQPDFVAWRCCYLVIGWLQVVQGTAVLVWGQDLPAGNYGSLRRAGGMAPSNSAREYWAAASNYRTWLLAAVYGFSFGVELTMNNVLAQYLYDTFDISLTEAGALASVFSLVNVFARPAGGALSDAAARRCGMRGRLWVLWALQSTAAALCCGLSQTGGSLGASMALVVCMALAETAAAGATFGIVPFISRRGLGAANGIVGSGASVGSILLQALFFTGSHIDWGEGFLFMGLTALAMTQLLLLLRFPMWGGMVPGRLLPCLARRAGACEEDYYSSDFTAAERRLGLHASVLKFAVESRSQRGSMAARSVAEEPPDDGDRATAAVAHSPGDAAPGVAEVANGKRAEAG